MRHSLRRRYGRARKRELSVFDKHQLKIAQQTLRMPDAMLGVMGGGMSKEDAARIVRELTAKKYGHAHGGSIYDTLKAAGCELDHHESDLYVKATPEAMRLTAGHPNRSTFISQVDGKRWIELPFEYKPFWEKRR